MCSLLVITAPIRNGTTSVKCSFSQLLVYYVCVNVLYSMYIWCVLYICIWNAVCMLHSNFVLLKLQTVEDLIQWSSVALSRFKRKPLKDIQINVISKNYIQIFCRLLKLVSRKKYQTWLAELWFSSVFLKAYASMLRQSERSAVVTTCWRKYCTVSQGHSNIIWQMEVRLFFKYFFLQQWEKG